MEAASARPVAAASGAELRAGPWLRATALGAAAASGLTVASAVAGLGPVHRLLALLGLPPLAAVLVAALLAHRRLVPLAAAALGLLALEIGLGAAVEALGTPRWAAALHLAGAAAALAVTVALAASLARGTSAAAGSWRDYVTLTKPRIMSLLLLTGLCGMVVGERGFPGPGRVTAMLVGLALACGGASALNHVLDADIDRLMGARTSSRPVAAGRIAVPRALEFALALTAASFVLLAATLNLLTAALALAGNLFYVLVYTRWLKRTTPQNIVIGGAAGAVPPLVGFAAAHGALTPTAALLFAIVFFWTPPHFWALALLLERGYANAGVPMLPVVRGQRTTVRQIVGYTLVLVAVTLAPFALGPLGLPYLAAALVLGGVFLALALRLARETTRRRAGVLFHYSLLYLALLFVAAALDAAL